MTNRQYAEIAKKRAPASPIVKDCLMAFGFGGGLCLLAEFCADGLKSIGVTADDSALLTTVFFILIGGVLTGLRIYDNIAKYAGAGIVVPITGFANSIVSPAMEFKSEGLVLGLGAKMFTVAGPVLAYGLSASVIYGMICYLLGGIF